MGFPTCKYRRGAFGRGVESRVFDSDDIPPGWLDSPAEVEEMAKTPKKPPARKKPRVSALAD